MTEDGTSGGSRRALLAALGAGAVASLAGCGGGDENDSGDGGVGTTDPTAAGTSTAGGATSTAPSPSTATTAETTVAPTTTRATTTVPTTLAPTMTSAADAPTTTAVGPDAADIVVATDDTGEYSSIDDAFSAVEADSDAETLIYVHAGTYEEQVTLPANRRNVTVVGEDVAETVLTHALHAEEVSSPTATATATLNGDDLTVRNLTVENTAEPRAQKLAVLAEGDRQFFHNCRFRSHQDTLYTREPGNRQYFLECRVSGTVDFVYGDATAVLDRCELVCRYGGGYVTAANTLPEYDGITVKHSTVRGDEFAEDGSFTLGRPWGPNADTAFVDCELGAVIAAQGWSDWGGRGETATYVECANRGEGFVPEERVDWATVLDPERLGEFHLVFEEWDPLGKTD